MISQSTTAPQVTMCMRDAVCNSVYERQQSIRDRLKTLESNGRIGEVSMRVWGKQIPTHEQAVTGPGIQSCIQLYNEFNSWTDQAGYSLEPGFSRRSIDSLVTDEQQVVIRVPIICLAAYNDGNIIDVAPRSTANGTHGVDDFIAALETNGCERMKTQSGNLVEGP